MSTHRTPLRYPGGKQRLAPFVAEVLAANDYTGGDYAEPYAGGAGVACELLLDNKVARVHLNDKSPAVYAFWRAILTKTEEFCRLISCASLTVEEWRRQREILKRPKGHSQLELGFSVFYLNRCNRSGILSGGVIGGLNQTGDWKIDARFPRQELIRRIRALATRRSDIVVKNEDAEDFLTGHVAKLPPKSLVYCDPPYFHKAQRLYLNHYEAKDHQRIARIMQTKVKHRWMVSYDNVTDVLQYYHKRRSFLYSLQYSAQTAYEGTEVIIVSDKLVLPKNSSTKSIDTALAKFAG